MTLPLTPSGSARTITPSGSASYSGSWDTTIKVWGMNTLMCVQTFQGHSHFITCLSLFSTAHQNRLYSGSYDKTIRVWDTVSNECVYTIKGHSKWVVNLCLSEDGSRLYSGSEDCTIKAQL